MLLRPPRAPTIPKFMFLRYIQFNHSSSMYKLMFSTKRWELYVIFGSLRVLNVRIHYIQHQLSIYVKVSHLLYFRLTKTLRQVIVFHNSTWFCGVKSPDDNPTAAETRSFWPQKRQDCT